jgi:UDP-glucose 4-epimerase
MKVMITGGDGFIGRYIQEIAQEHGDEVTCFDRAWGHDVTVPEDFDKFDPHHVVIHLAGMLGTAELFDTPRSAVNVNVTGTLNVLDWCRRTGAGYVGITMPDSSWSNVYQATKLCAMRLATAWHRNEGVPVSHVRAFNAFGAGQKHGPGHPQKIIPTFSYHSWRGEPIPIWGNGLQTVDLIHAKDVAQMLYRATRFGDDEIFDAGNGVAMTVNAVAMFVNRITGSTAGVEYLPMRKGEEPDTHIIAKGEGWGALDWNPELDYEVLAQTVMSYKP